MTRVYSVRKISNLGLDFFVDLFDKERYVGTIEIHFLRGDVYNCSCNIVDLPISAISYEFSCALSRALAVYRGELSFDDLSLIPDSEMFP